MLLLATSFRDVLDNFDIDPSRVGGYVDASGDLRVVCSSTWLQCVLQRRFPIHSSRWTTSSTFRALKYATKGFQPYVAGLDRSVSVPRRLDECEGCEEILAAERVVAGSRNPIELLARAWPAGRRSGYLDGSVPANKWKWILRALSWTAAVRRLWPGVKRATETSTSWERVRANPAFS